MPGHVKSSLIGTDLVLPYTAVRSSPLQCKALQLAVHVVTTIDIRAFAVWAWAGYQHGHLPC